MLVAKAYNLKAVEKTLAGRTVSVISLGEEGRGRQLTAVPCTIGIENNSIVLVTLSETKTSGIVTKPRIALLPNTSETVKLWCARISTSGAYIRGAQGNVSSNTKDVILVAKGTGAFGDAGRTGDWDDVLVLVPDNTVLRVKPTRADAFYLLFSHTDVVKLTKDELELLELNFDFENRIRL